jgi:hypothetical protein
MLAGNGKASFALGSQGKQKASSPAPNQEGGSLDGPNNPMKAVA